MKAPTGDDEGFGMVEVMVSILLFAIVLLMTVGLLISALRASARNSSIESATQWAAEQIDAAHAAVAGLDYSKACPKWTDVVGAGSPANRPDGRGMAMKLVVTADATPTNCMTAAVPPVVTYSVKVVEAARPTHVLATSTTKIALGLE